MNDGLAPLEAALEHHADELSVGAAARVRSLTLLRRLLLTVSLGGYAALLVGAFVAGVRSSVIPLIAVGPFVIAIGLNLNRRARIAIARHGLRAVEAGRDTRSLGGALSPAGAGSAVPAALSVPAASLKAPRVKRTRTRARAPDRDAVDFDDGA